MMSWLIRCGRGCPLATEGSGVGGLREAGTSFTVRDIITRIFRRPAVRALVLSFIGIVLNVVAAAVHVSILWMFILLALAFIGTVALEASQMRASKVHKESNRLSFKIEPSDSWLELILLALLYTLIGVGVSVIVLMLPLQHDAVLVGLFGGLAHVQFYWYVYHFISVAVISVGAFVIGIWRRSLAKLILYVLFSPIGMMLPIAAFENDIPIFMAYWTAIGAVGLIGFLTFYRSRFVVLLGQTFGPADTGVEEDSSVHEKSIAS